MVDRHNDRVVNGMTDQKEKIDSLNERYRETDTQMDRHIDRQTDRSTDRQTDTQIERNKKKKKSGTDVYQSTLAEY